MLAADRLAEGEELGSNILQLAQRSSANLRNAYAGALSRGGLRFLLDPRKESILARRRKGEGAAILDCALDNRPSTGRGNGRPAVSPTSQAPIRSQQGR